MPFLRGLGSRRTQSYDSLCNGHCFFFISLLSYVYKILRKYKTVPLTIDTFAPLHLR